MSSLIIAGDTSGTITLQAPAAAGSNVLSLPAETGTVLTSVSPAVALPGSLSVAGLITGSTNYTGFKNRFINGRMRFAQRATSATVTAATTVPTISTGYPCVDRWFVYCTGANVTAAQIAGAGAIQNLLQVTGAASVTAIGIGQRIESNNVYDLAGSTCTLSVDLANSLLTTVTWTASYATTTADTFGTIGTPTKTQIATGTFTVSASLTNYQTSFIVPAAAITGVEILFTVGAQTSGTWTMGRAQFEKGAVKTDYDFRDYGRELQMCQRYYQKLGGNVASDILFQGYQLATTNISITLSYLVAMRSTPTSVKAGTWNVINAGQPSISGTGLTSMSITATATASANAGFYTQDTTTYISLSAEIP